MRLIHLLVGLILLPAWSLAAGPELWLYYQTNLLPAENITQLEAVWTLAAKAGYTKVLLADFKFGIMGRLGANEKSYLANLARVREIARDLKLEIVPAIFNIGYSNSILANDPNLAEGLPARNALFVVKGEEARLVADPPVGLAAQPDWYDPAYTLNRGVATSRGHKGNARLVWKLSVSPYRAYHVSVKVKCKDYSGELEIKPIVGRSRVLAFTKLGVKPSQDWTQHDIVFGSLDNQQVSIYMGAWGDAAGEVQLRDWKIEEIGLLNVLRRPGTPCVVEGYVEGKDYEPIVDPKLGIVPYAGDYSVWHEPPSIRTSLPEGTKLRVSWYFPVVINTDQVCCCPSEPRVAELLADEAFRVLMALEPRGLMMSHDEVRVLNWDQSCQERKLTPGQILASNVAYCARLLPYHDLYVWNDMFDPNHNAVDDFYLVNGDLSKSWEGLEPRITVVNWHFGNRDKSLRFFANRGHKQVIAAYYDGPVEQARQWLKSADGVPGVTGIMYTTWQHNYADIERFAEVVRSSSQR